MLPEHRQVFLFQTHYVVDEIRAEYAKVARSVAGLGPVKLLHHDTTGEGLEWPANECFIVTEESLTALGYQRVGTQWMPGHVFFPLMQFYLANPDYDYYWLIEYDVRYSGEWDEFFGAFSGTDADLITAHVYPYAVQSDWLWWHLDHPTKSIAPEGRLRSFNPVKRMSRRALQVIHECLREGWVGHQEVLIATLLFQRGLRIEDIGGSGPFTPAERKNRFFRSPRQNSQGHLREETHRFRPAFPAVGDEPATIYHPVKPVRWEGQQRAPADALADAHSLYEQSDLAGAEGAYATLVYETDAPELLFEGWFRLCLCRAAAQRPAFAVVEAFLEAWSADPTRPEPFDAMAAYQRSLGHWELALVYAVEARRLGSPTAVDQGLYPQHSWDEYALTHYLCGDFDTAFDEWRALLNAGGMSESEYDRLRENVGYAMPSRVQHVMGRPTEVIAAVVARRVNLDGSSPGGVTLTVSSGLHPDWLETTVDSFLHCCRDLHHVRRWICLWEMGDPASLERARERYPFFEFVDAATPGDPVAGFQQLARLIEGTFWLTLMPGWRFLVPDRYIERAWDIFSEDFATGQVLFNRNYGNTVYSASVAGGIAAETETGARYRRHEYDPSQPEPRIDGPPESMQVAGWPHLALRPGMIRTANAKMLCEFAKSEVIDELSLAHRFVDEGLETAFFDYIAAQRLDSPLAFELTCARPSPDWCDPSAQDYWVVNLRRRPDRLAEFNDNAGRHMGALAARVTRFEAVDGVSLEASDELRRTFANNHFGWRRGVMGCASSHLALWRAAAETNRACVVFEDDARPMAGFDVSWPQVCADLQRHQPDYDVLFLGYHGAHRDGRGSPGDWPICETLSTLCYADFRGGTFAYLLSPTGARKLLALVERDGLIWPVDNFVMENADHLTILRCNPEIVCSRVAEFGAGDDTDIQYDFTTLAV